MKIARALSELANSTSSLYRIVFTGLLLIELVRFRWRKNSAESYTDNDHRARR